MDTRTGDIYRSRQEALDAGVPSELLEQVDAVDTGAVITITSGPFKGRKYVRNADGSLGRRVRSSC